MFECLTEERLQALSRPLLDYEAEAFADRLTPGIFDLAHRGAANTAVSAFRREACPYCAIYLVGVRLGILLERAWREERKLAGERP